MSFRNKIIIFFLLLYNISFSQLQLIKGKIVDRNSGVSLESVSIRVVNTDKMVYSNPNGFFQIETEANLEISLKGYTTKIIEVEQNKKMIIRLEPNSIILDETVINGNTIQNKANKVSESISIIPKIKINQGDMLFTDQILNTVPGVFMQSGALNTSRITIRGIGARSSFSTAKIRAYFGDIPLTDGNGESAIEDLELASVAQFEIHKGPSSSNFGVGLGGTILLYPKFTDFLSTKTRMTSTFGSYGSERHVLNASHGGEKYTVNFVYSNNKSDGYRKNNKYHRKSFTVTSRWYLDDNNSLTFLGNLYDLKAFIPSSLNKNDYDNNPKEAAASWKKSQGFEDVTSSILGVTWEHQYQKKLRQQTSIFGTIKDNYEPRPFNILKESAYSFGARTRLLGNIAQPWKLKWSIGAEYFEDLYREEKYKNLYADFPEGTGSVQGEKIYNTFENRKYYNFFGEILLKQKNLSINLGTHFNQTIYNNRNDFPSHSKMRSNYTFKPIYSPKLGLNYAINERMHLFGNISKGFSTPSTGETLNLDGQFNKNIGPEKGWNYEIGSRFKTKDERFNFSLSWYTLRIENLLVSRRTETDESIVINAGKTNHNGIESEINYKVIKTNQATLLTTISTSIHDYKFKDFIDLDNDYSGNDLTGVPKFNLNFGLFLLTPKGMYGNFRWQWVGKMPANDKNSIYAEEYSLVYSKVGYKKKMNKHFSYDLFVGINNMLNTKYASQLQVNAYGSDSTARYFYPGLPIYFYGGINLSYIL